jgi:para-nitrobenzyl esterase
MQQNNDHRIDRRRLLTGAAWTGGAAALALTQTGCTTSITEAGGAPAGAIIVASDHNAVVETGAGKVRGFSRNGIQTFKGIPYAASTEGSARFLAPSKPKPWTGIRSTMYYGPTCPQAPRTGWMNDENAFLFQWDDGQPGEDCLRVNVWTPGVNDGKKRPVMVWLHGGGWAAGSGQEQPAYNGENLSKRGDVVVVSLNHRLNMLGYMNLAAYGEKYASSMNAGVLDLVAALEWVRDNIANFGGDPGNVLIFGQSGGGGKVSTLCSMPMAKGLFHRAVVQSGSTLRLGDPELAAKIAAATISELGITKATIDKIQTTPYTALLDAQAAALKKLQPTPPAGGIGMPMVRGAAPRMGFGPVVDGKIVTRHPFDPDAPAESASVPMLIGTVLNESSPSMVNPALESMTEDDMRKRAAERYKDKAGMVVDAYRKAYPDVKPVELLSRMMSVRTNAVTQAELKAAQKSAPAYMYLFAWQTPVLDGRPRAFHCSEIPFVFANSDVSSFATGGTAEARQLAGKVSDAWISFAKKGDPNHSGLPHWPAYSADAGPVMVFDKTCEVKNDPDRELRKVVADALKT